MSEWGRGSLERFYIKLCGFLLVSSFLPHLFLTCSIITLPTPTPVPFIFPLQPNSIQFNFYLTRNSTFAIRKKFISRHISNLNNLKMFAIVFCSSSSLFIISYLLHNRKTEQTRPNHLSRGFCSRERKSLFLLRHLCKYSPLRCCI